MALVFTDLSPVQQQMVQQDTGHHGLSHWNRTYAHTGIVAAFGNEFGLLTGFCNRPARGQDA